MLVIYDILECFFTTSYHPHEGHKLHDESFHASVGHQPWGATNVASNGMIHDPIGNLSIKHGNIWYMIYIYIYIYYMRYDI